MKRDFTYIDDILSGTAAAIDLGSPCETFNLGNNRPVALLDLIGIIEERLKKKAIMEMLPEAIHLAGDQARLCGAALVGAFRQQPGRGAGAVEPDQRVFDRDQRVAGEDPGPAGEDP